jgi:hypothetical protein
MARITAAAVIPRAVPITLFLVLPPPMSGCSQPRTTPAGSVTAASPSAAVSRELPAVSDDLRVAGEIWTEFYSRQYDWLRTEGLLWGYGEEKLARNFYDADSIMTDLVMKFYDGKDDSMERVWHIRAILFGFHFGFLYGHKDAAQQRLYRDRAAQVSFCDELTDATRLALHDSQPGPGVAARAR